MKGLVGVAVGLCLVALVAAPAADAEAPEWGRCVKQAGGQFGNAACTTKVTSGGKFEWLPGAAKGGFTMALKEGVFAMESSEKQKPLVCTGATASGVITAPNSINHVVLVLTGCTHAPPKEGPCQSAGRAANEVVTDELEGVLGVNVKAAEAIHDRVALELRPEGAGNVVATFECNPAGRYVVTGSLLHLMHSNAMVTARSEVFGEAKGEQMPECFVPCSVDQHTLEFEHEGFAPLEAGWSARFLTTYEEPLEINPVV
jgi:hypothetical protein